MLSLRWLRESWHYYFTTWTLWHHSAQNKTKQKTQGSAIALLLYVLGGKKIFRPCITSVVHSDEIIYIINSITIWSCNRHSDWCKCRQLTQGCRVGMYVGSWGLTPHKFSAKLGLAFASGFVNKKYYFDNPYFFVSSECSEHASCMLISGKTLGSIRV